MNMQSSQRTPWVGLLLVFLPFATWATESAPDAVQPARYAYKFDYRMLYGKMAETAETNALVLPAAKSGTYGLEIRVNDRLIGVHQVRLTHVSGVFRACLEAAVIERLGISEKALSRHAHDILDGSASCVTAERLTDGAKFVVDFSNLKLDISIPQASLAIANADWPMPDQWESGETAGRIAYNSNYFEAQNPAGKNKGVFLALDMGLDVGKYHVRQHANLSAQQSAGAKNFTARNDSIVLFTDIEQIGATATLGQSYTRARLFEPTVIRGLNIQTDDRMLAPEWRSPKPAIEGISRTGSRIEIRQFGVLQYETSVPPGPYRLTDLPLSGNGFDLDVTAIESDGVISRFAVPTVTSTFLLPEGSDFGNLSIGEMLSSARRRHAIAQFEWQSGVSHGFTLNAGLTGLKRYAAGLLGAGASTPLGAVSLNVTGSRSGAETMSEKMRGGSISGSFSKGFSRTNTNFVIGAIRLSSRGYESALDNVDRKDQELGRFSAYWHAKFRSRVNVSIGQRLGDFGNLTLSAARSVAWNGGTPSDSLAAAYSLMFRNGMALNTSVARSQYVGNKAQWTGTLGLSVPLGGTFSSSGGSTVTLSGTGSNSGPGQYALGYNNSIALSDGRSVSYGTSASSQVGATGDLSGYANYNSTTTNAAMHLSGNASHRQFFGSVNGAAVIHRGGINFARNLGDTLVLVHAPGAEGARIGGMNEQLVADNGYALLSFANPYARNVIDMGTAQDNIGYRADDPIKTIIPRAGTVTTLSFAGSLQDVFLLSLNTHGLGQPSFGAEIRSSEGTLLGYVGQGGRAEVRVPSDVRYVQVTLDAKNKRMCRSDLNEARKKFVRVGDIKQASVSCVPAQERTAPEAGRPLARLP
ncbi:fimbria/pilus outer membrane usher protein [Leptothrix sp. BB-4]